MKINKLLSILNITTIFFSFSSFSVNNDSTSLNKKEIIFEGSYYGMPNSEAY